ncbi:MAG: hypothetical protein WBJ75_14140 [Pseudohongiellaceae bacterium]
MDAILNFAHTSGIYAFMNSAWGWPTVESLHFIGLCLLIGTVGVFDLRMLGVGRGIPMVALHRLVPWGVLGFALNVTTGLMFFVSAPDQYAFNPAFQTKMVFMALAGMNMLLFYGWAQRQVHSTAASERAPGRAMVIAAVSLSCWSLVIVCGRLITYFRPPYHWCVWC